MGVYGIPWYTPNVAIFIGKTCFVKFNQSSRLPILYFFETNEAMQFLLRCKIRPSGYPEGVVASPTW